ncbi:H(+)/Cl(-) exchange transporter 5-like, partial [Osmerus eperlanus]|uniref:H(+)/Cl(-) exchange transporter 5-like n=1 Tax=Osmerus eperlanus TaxID=29151 RepID=UPI002E0F1005
MDNGGFCNGSYDSVQSPASDDELVDIGGATLDFSSTDDVPPLDRDLNSGKRPPDTGGRETGHRDGRSCVWAQPRESS